MIHLLILALVLVPLSGWLLLALIRTKKEKTISTIAITTVALQSILAICTTIYWLLRGHLPYTKKEWVLYASHDYEFYFDFYFDHISAAFVLIGSLLTLLVCTYSRVYMHREEGYRRFFQTILFFLGGFSLTVVSGNLETLFIGWEILGISSFLLIAFYRDRYLPVKNAVKVFSIYRIGDLGILMAMWLSHHFWGGNITFYELQHMPEISAHLNHYGAIATAIGMMLVLTAFAKSAVFPFSFWLPRAMEGPTPSSAIFYGSISVHLGIFLLLRTHDFWYHLPWIKATLFLGGLISLVTGGAAARVQSSIKSQIAYASIAQIGIMMMELSLDLTWLALIHFIGNALLRTYQLLVSPSVATYKIREQTYRVYESEALSRPIIASKLRTTIYVLSLNEWNLDPSMYRYLWNPLKNLGTRLGILTVMRTFILFGCIMAMSAVLLVTNYHLPNTINITIPFLFGALAVGMVLKSFTERHNPFAALLMVMMNHCLIAVAVAFNELYEIREAILYLSGILIAGGLGYYVLWRFKKIEPHLDLGQFHGHSYKHPKIAFAFLIACLGLTGFPITPTFLGEDLIFSHIHEYQIGLASLVALSFVLDGLAIIRIYARLFLGPHSQSIHEMGYRSS